MGVAVSEICHLWQCSNSYLVATSRDDLHLVLRRLCGRTCYDPAAAVALACFRALRISLNDVPLLSRLGCFLGAASELLPYAL